MVEPDFRGPRDKDIGKAKSAAMKGSRSVNLVIVHLGLNAAE